MKLFVVFAIFVFGPSLFAETLAVLGKNQVSVIDPSGTVSAVVDNVSHRAFVSALSARRKQSDYDVVAPILLPPEWGKTVANSGGEVRYQRSFAQGFVAHLSLHDLAPRHLYVLTLNGTPLQPGNERLPDPVPGLPEERFYDFLRIITDETGGYEADLGIYLLPGPYHVRIYVKDTDDFKIVLFRDFFDFSVTPGATPPPAKPAPAAPPVKTP